MGTEKNAQSGDCQIKYPIFILGIGMRSGTNSLLNQLCVHPDCEPGGLIWEDFLTAHADLLVRYADSVCEHWGSDFATDEIMVLKELLTQSLGNGLISFLNLQSHGKGLFGLPPNERAPVQSFKRSPKRLVTKTPSVVNLEHFFAVFPCAHLLIIIRDGRAVVESSVKWLDWNNKNVIAGWLKRFKYEIEMRKWAKAARTILRFCKNNGSSQYLVVKYEDLWNNLEKAFCEILEFLHLDEELYDFDTAANLPVRGSSVFRGHRKEVHWHAVEKTSDFNPTLRWSHWNRALHERFNWIAGEYLVKFGYQKKHFTTNRFFWTAWNVISDILWLAMGFFLARMSESTRFRGFKDKLRTYLKTQGRVMEESKDADRQPRRKEK